MTTAKLVGQQNQCPTCGQFFSKNSGFERHRVGKFSTGRDNTSPERHCLTIEEMYKVGFSLSADGFWRFSRPGSTWTPPEKETEEKLPYYLGT